MLDVKGYMRLGVLQLVLLVCFLPTKAQVSVTTGSYGQNFGTADISSWSNNSTYPGWYSSSLPLVAHINMTTSAPTNTGGFYTYECNGNNNQKIGSRASGGTGLSTIRYGVVLRNQTGTAIRSIRVSYTGYQMSLAQNGSVVNTLTFDYVTSSSLPAITAGSSGSVSSLDFAQVVNSTVAGGLQIQGYPCTRSRSQTGCISLATPLANNSYILLRWTDVDDTNNDHHMAIDDVQVDFDLTGATCNDFLPVELLFFDARVAGDVVQLEWATGSERNNDHFVVHSGTAPEELHPILRMSGALNSQQRIQYDAVDDQPLPDISYYRLQQVDTDGSTTWSNTVAVQRSAERSQELIVGPNPSPDGRFVVRAPWDAEATIEVCDMSGRTVHRTRVTTERSEVDLSNLGTGCYLLRYLAGARLLSTRVLVPPR